jgi:hypothetical protein
MMVPVRPRPARQCTATPPLFSNYFTTSVNFFTVLSEGQDPSGNSMSNTLIPYRSKIRASYNDSLRRTMHLIPICLKIGNNFSGVYDGYYLLTVYDGEAHARISPGTTQLQSKLLNSLKRSF